MHVNKNSTIFISYILYCKKKYETYGFATKADQADQPETESEPHKASGSWTHKIRKRDRIRGRQLELGQDLFLDEPTCPCVFNQILR
jgi:hypothetical protein